MGACACCSQIKSLFGRGVGLLVARLVGSGFWVRVRLECRAGWTASGWVIIVKAKKVSLEWVKLTLPPSSSSPSPPLRIWPTRSAITNRPWPRALHHFCKIQCTLVVHNVLGCKVFVHVMMHTYVLSPHPSGSTQLTRTSLTTILAHEGIKESYNLYIAYTNKAWMCTCIIEHTAIPTSYLVRHTLLQGNTLTVAYMQG